MVGSTRAIDSEDVPALLALNNEHEVELARADVAGFVDLLAHAALAHAVGPTGAPIAFLLAFDHTTPRRGPNHGWFLERRPSFLYVDRVCVAPSARRRGVARALYLAAFSAAAQRGVPMVCCEVNVDPPNPGSDAFHEALGFTEVGRAFLADRNKVVRYLERASL